MAATTSTAVAIAHLEEQIRQLTQGIVDLKTTIQQTRDNDVKDDKVRDDRLSDLEKWQNRVIGAVALLIVGFPAAVTITVALIKQFVH
jgi:TolA-binding protein